MVQLLVLPALFNSVRANNRGACAHTCISTAVVCVAQWPCLQGISGAARPFQRRPAPACLAALPAVIHERGSPETLRDPRGFAVKFYTREGNFDMVGNNIPVRGGTLWGPCSP